MTNIIDLQAKIEASEGIFTNVKGEKFISQKSRTEKKLDFPFDLRYFNYEIDEDLIKKGYYNVWAMPIFEDYFIFKAKLLKKLKTKDIIERKSHYFTSDERKCIVFYSKKFMRLEGL